MMDLKINRKMLFMKLHYFFWNAGTAPIVPFLSTYLRQLGFSSAIVGVMYTVMPILGMLAKPLFGAIADRFRCQKVIFVTCILVAAGGFLATYYSPSIEVKRTMHLACDQSFAYLDTCDNSNECAVEELLLEVGKNGTVHCELNCQMEPQFWKTICEGWKVEKYCGNITQDYLEFGVTLPMYHMDQVATCLYFRIDHTIFDDEKHYPNCINATYHISTTCDVKCDEYLLNDLLAQPTAEDNDVYRRYEFWLVFLFMIIAWVGQAIVVSVSDAVCFAMLENQPNKYGVQRSFGALGWGIFSIIAGFMIDTSSSGVTKNYLPVFYLGAALLVVDFIISCKLNYTQKKMTTRIAHDVLHLFTNIRIVVFIAFCIFVGMCTGLIWQFFFWLIEDLAKEQGCGYMEWIKTLQGLIMGIQCLLGELPFFFVSGWILKRIGHVHAMSLILLVIGIRYILYSVISNPWYFLPVELLNGITFGLFYAAMASYASIVAPPGTETTVQGLVGAVFEGVGVSLGSLVAGQLFNECGGVWTFRIFGILSLILCLLHAGIQHIIRRSAQVSHVRYAAPQDAINIIDGYAVIEGFLTNQEVDALKAEIEKLIDKMPEKSDRAIFSTTTTDGNSKPQSKDKYFVDSADKISYFYESGALGNDGELLVPATKSLNKIGHALHDLNEVFRSVTLDVRVKETCFQLGFKDPVIPQSMYIFKNPGIGGEVIPHQDATYLYTDPLKVVGFWIALDDATTENGCLRFIRGSHKSGVHRRYIRNPDKTSDEFIIYDRPSPFYQMSSFVPVPVSKGSCVLIDGQVVHCSEANKSSKSRHAYTFHVVENENTKYSEENWLQYPDGKQFTHLYKN